MCRWVDIFQSHMTPSCWCYKLLGRSFTWTSPKSCTYPTLVTIDPLEVKIVSILLYKNSNCPTLFWTFTIDNSLFLTTIEKMFCVFLLSVKEFLIYKFRLLSFLKRLYNMSNLHLWSFTCHTVTQTWPIKHWQYLGMKL